jgi:hypothetical protein
LVDFLGRPPDLSEKVHDHRLPMLVLLLDLERTTIFPSSSIDDNNFIMMSMSTADGVFAGLYRENSNSAIYK